MTKKRRGSGQVGLGAAGGWRRGAGDGRHQSAAGVSGGVTHAAALARVTPPTHSPHQPVVASRKDLNESWRGKVSWL